MTLLNIYISIIWIFMGFLSINFEFMLEKGHPTKEYVRKNQQIMPNKPNSPIVQIHLTCFLTILYAIFISLTKVKNKPNSNPIFNPRCELTCFPVGGKADIKLIKTPSNPIQTQNKPNFSFQYLDHLKSLKLHKIVLSSLNRINIQNESETTFGGNTMKNQLKTLMCLTVVFLCGNTLARAAEPLEFRELFNGKDLSGWVNVNTADDTWSVRDGMIVCSGHPIGVMRTDRQYENFVLHIEWRHMEAGGNSGVFIWSEGTVPEGRQLPKGLEVQMLELDWVNQHKRKDGTLPPIAYVHGEVFGAGGLKTVPDNPRGSRSKSIENRCKGKGQWNTYVVVCVDGVVKLSVNGKFVNGISKASVKKGYICLESEGGEIHFRNIRIMELPPGITSAENTAPLVKNK
jgi:hypothetical protein